MRAISLVVLVALAGSGGGCVVRAPVDTLQRRAAFEFDCPPEKIQMARIDDRTVLVQGCDQRATYVETCERYGKNNESGECHWVLDHKRDGRSSAGPSSAEPSSAAPSTTGPSSAAE